MSGKVYIVGAGPGAADLLTLRAANLLRNAEVVLHDDLVSPEVLNLIAPSAEVINVGKRCGKHSTSQEQINALMVFYARRDATAVVRLKSGDPAIFGRLGEEIECLRHAEIPFEIVPGITAASAAAAAAQVSLTDRRSASTVVFTTPHRCAGKENTDWLRMARRDATLAIYMPGSGYEALAHDLEAAGFSGETPCLIISGAATHRQQARRTTLSQLAGLPPLPAPSLLLIGESLEHRHQETGADLEEVSLSQSFETPEGTFRIE